MNARNIRSRKVHAFGLRNDGKTLGSGCGLLIELWGPTDTTIERKSFKKAGTGDWPTYVEMLPLDSVRDYGVELCWRCFAATREAS